MRAPELVLLCALATLMSGGCATTSEAPRKKDKSTSRFVNAFEAALEAHDVEPPRSARSISDIRLFSKVYGLLVACVPGKTPDFSVSWLQDRAGRSVHTSVGDKTLGEIAQSCQTMFDKLNTKPIEACGARYVQLERKLRDDDAYGKPRVAKSSEGWYMTPCDRPPGSPLTREQKNLELPVRDACEDPKANLYLLSNWADDGERMVATVACIAPRQERLGWLPGNPGLGLK